MPYRNKQDYREYMRGYMKNQRRHQAKLKRQFLHDEQKMTDLRKQFPLAYELLFGKQQKRKK